MTGVAEVRVATERALEVAALADDAKVVVVSATTGEGMGDLAPHLAPGQTIALLGCRERASRRW